MRLQPVTTVSSISGADFRQHFFEPGIPVVIKDLAQSWPAMNRWNWDYMREKVGDKKVGIYNNVKSGPHTPVNQADAYVTMGEYIDRVRKGPAEWRIFLFNIFNHAPELVQDFTWPDHLMKGFVKRVPMLFMGGEGSITHMHFDMDLSHILHTQFLGKKRVLLFPYEEGDKLYRKPFEVMSMADFSYYYDASRSRLDMERYSALRHAKGYEVILDHGDTLFMPGGYWHHMEYVQSGFAMSLRALQESWSKKFNGAWNLTVMRNIDTLLKKTAPHRWHEWKERQVHARAARHIETTTEDCGGFAPSLGLLWKEER